MTLPARKRHSVVPGLPVPPGVIDEVPTEAGTWVDEDSGEWVATYRPGAALPLRSTAMDLRYETVTGGSPETFPSQLQPWVDLAACGYGCAGLITTDMPETPVHIDSWTQEGLVDGRSTCLCVYREGTFTGGEYVLAEYGLAFDMQDGDLLLAPTQVLHGNAPRVGSGYHRIVVIFCLSEQPT